MNPCTAVVTVLMVLMMGRAAEIVSSDSVVVPTSSLNVPTGMSAANCRKAF